MAFDRSFDESVLYLAHCELGNCRYRRRRNWYHSAGTRVSRYHLEAAIAAEHCQAKEFENTNWEAICHYYEQLETRYSSYQFRLNRAVALAEWKDAAAGLELLMSKAPPTWMKQSYVWMTVAADLHFRSGNTVKGREYAELAVKEAPSSAIRALIQHRLSAREVS